ncbi:c-type cytochrome [Chloroflexota bacterium]
MKLKLLPVMLLVILFTLMLATVVRAQGEPPPPYAGMKNPFPWDDSSAQDAGMDVYKQSCLGCHGIKGENLADYNFSNTDYSQSLETEPDYYFWVVTEGRLDKGMPGYSSSLSDEQRWQVLTYLRSLGAAAPPEATLIAEAPAEIEGGALRLALPEQAEPGQVIILKATLQDDDGKPVANAGVKFFRSAELFIIGLIEIGEVTTDGQGLAVLEYTPQQAGEVEVTVRSGTAETAGIFSVAHDGESAYETEAGLHLPQLGDDIFFGPESALDLGEESNAPATALRIPGGVFSWLMIVAFTVFFIWFTYFRVMYQVFRIPIVNEIRDINTRMVPTIGLVMIVLVGLLLVMMLITGPYSHLHLPR